MDKEIIKQSKHLIKTNNLIELQKAYHNIIENQINISIPYLYKEVFYYSCQLGNEKIIKWLTEVYNNMEDINQISLRQIFPYGKYLLNLNKEKNGKIVEWYDTVFLPTTRKQ